MVQNFAAELRLRAKLPASSNANLTGTSNSQYQVRNRSEQNILLSNLALMHGLSLANFVDVGKSPSRQFDDGVAANFPFFFAGE